MLKLNQGVQVQIQHLTWPLRGLSELNSLSFCIVHLFRFTGEDGRETKQWSLDVLKIARGLPQCLLSQPFAEGPSNIM
jgi:hypothetical protein